MAIKTIAYEIAKSQEVTKLRQLREHLLKLIVNNVPTDIIIYNLVKALCSYSDVKEDAKKGIISWAAIYDNRSQNGSKPLFHLEALVARIMLIIKNSK